MLKNKVRRGCTVLSPPMWPSTKKSDGTEKFMATGSVDGCNILLVTHYGSYRREVRVCHQTAF